jgi:sulfate transport system substrate-binding protein
LVRSKRPSNITRYVRIFVCLLLLLATLSSVFTAGCRPNIGAGIDSAPIELLNVSYDPTRELFAELNPLFVADWNASHARPVTISMSHGGGGRQARAVIDGLPADVVTLATSIDIDAMHEQRALLPADWQSRLDHDSCPYFSTIVFVVRAGNPQNIATWDDLARDGVSVITPNPKTSGGARWAYLAAWAWALRQSDGSEDAARAFLGRIFANVPVLDTGARGASNTFAQNNIGDVLLTWENEAQLLLDDVGHDAFEVIVPAFSIRAEPPVAMLDANVDANGTREAAQAYLEFLYTPPAQRVIAAHHYRPTDPEVAREFADAFADTDLITVNELGGWPALQEKHFQSGGIFDQIYEAGQAQ